MKHTEKETSDYQGPLVLAGLIYLLWWFAVEFFLPKAYNPFLSRFVVVVCIFAAWGLSFLSAWGRKRVRIFFILAMWLITTHFFYLFYKNSGDVDWIVGSLITVSATSFGFLSSSALLVYSVYVLLLSGAIILQIPEMHQSLFFPGILTILIQANIGLRLRLKLIRRLEVSKERFRLLFDSAFEGILVHDGLKILDANKSLAQMLETTPEDLIGSSVFNIIYSEDRDLVVEKISHSESSAYEVRGLKKDGGVIDLEVRGREIVDGKITARLVTMLDLTDRKKAEQERIRAMTIAETAKVRDEFISIVSHEFKTPLSVLKLQGELIEWDILNKKIAIDPPHGLDRAITNFNRQIARLTELIEAMLDVSRISANRLVVERGEMDLVDCIRDVVLSLQTDCSNEGRAVAPIITHIPEHMLICADRIRICQVIKNLLTNALKYGEHRPVLISLVAEGAFVYLTVKDEGIGIAPEFLDRVLERFERAISAEKISGLGLGLFIARKIVEAHGGQLSVESELGKGTSITVKLPVR